MALERSQDAATPVVKSLGMTAAGVFRVPIKRVFWGLYLFSIFIQYPCLFLIWMTEAFFKAMTGTFMKVRKLVYRSLPTEIG